MWPTSESRVLTELFQRGRVSGCCLWWWCGPDQGIRLPEGVVDALRGGVDKVDGGDSVDMRDDPTGRREICDGGIKPLRRAEVGGARWLLALDEDRDFLFPDGVTGRPRLDMTTDEGGELPGVSWPLVTVDLSLESRL